MQVLHMKYLPFSDFSVSSVADPGKGPGGLGTPPPLFLDQSHQNCERAKTKCLRAGPHLTSRSGFATGLWGSKCAFEVSFA